MKKRILGDHKKEGKKFIPPFNYLLGGFSEINYVERILPEIAWIQYFVEALGKKEGVRIVTSFLKTLFEHQKSDVLPEFSHLSLIGEIPEAAWVHLSRKLADAGILDLAQEALGPFIRTYPEGNPLRHLVSVTPPPDPAAIDLARRVVAALFDRRSATAMFVQAIIVLVELETGKVQYTENVPYPDLDAIFERPDSHEGQRAASHVRNNVNQIHAFYQGKIGDGWARYFWNRGKALAPLRTDAEKLVLPDSDDPIISFCRDYDCHMRSLLDKLWRALPIDIFESEPFEVIGALLSRQSNLAIILATTPDLWNFSAGPLFLRAMVDCYISVAWILRDPLDRSRKFISYGLGQEKLQVEHLKSELEELEENEEKNRLRRSIDAREGWINSQRFAFLQEVDVGSWSGLNTRKMAEESECLDLYRFAYTPWSQAAHGIWNHVGQFNSKISPEPLHKHLRHPFFFQHQNLDLMINGTRYLDKLYNLLLQSYSLNIDAMLPYEWLIDRLQNGPDPFAASDNTNAG